MSNPTTDNIPGEGVLERVTAAIGRPLLEFVLNTSIENAASGNLTDEQFGILRKLNDTLTGPLTEQLDITNLHELLRIRLALPGEAGRPLANKLHFMCGGTLPAPSEGTSAGDLLQALGLDVFPASLLPPDDRLWPIMFGPPLSHQVSMVLHRHPRAKAFEAAILDDPVFGAIFGEDEPHTGRTAETYRSTFRGGGLQLSMLAYAVLVNAWRKASNLDAPPGVDDFCRLAQQQLDFMRSALSGKAQTVRVLQAFAGVLLPPGTTWHAGKGVLVRETTSRDRQLAPESLKQQLTGTDAAGVTTVVNYDGDIVVESDYPYKIKAFKDSVDDSSLIMDELSDPEVLERLTTRLRLSLLLAVERDYKVQLAPTWLYFDDPFDSGASVSWSDPRQASGLMPTQLTADELRAWQEWFAFLANPHTDRVSVALSRVIRAIGERREPSDVLIDAVIAWENLFGTKEGEPTLRVTASLALLLEATPESRRTRRTRLAKIYNLRSDVVHGNKALTKNDYPLCYEALDIAILALRKLLSERTDVLAQPDGAQRSLHLILGQ